jgi:SpoVK/Ycf46/Vps4 family AAA+-type ATPase
MGETSARLRLVFDAIQKHRGVYLFDEFDSIGVTRGSGNDVGEIRRILNSFLQFIDQDNSDSLILAATNHPDILDYALFRRFDDIIEYDYPQASKRGELLRQKLIRFQSADLIWDQLIEASEDLSYSEINKACEDAVKEAIIQNKEKVDHQIILGLLKERKRYQNRIFGRKT